MTREFSAWYIIGLCKKKIEMLRKSIEDAESKDDPTLPQIILNAKKDINYLEGIIKFCQDTMGRDIVVVDFKTYQKLI